MAAPNETAATASAICVRCHVSYLNFSFGRHKAITTSAISDTSDTIAKTPPHGTSSMDIDSPSISGENANMISACVPTRPTATSETCR